MADIFDFVMDEHVLEVTEHLQAIELPFQEPQVTRSAKSIGGAIVTAAWRYTQEHQQVVMNNLPRLLAANVDVHFHSLFDTDRCSIIIEAGGHAQTVGKSFHFYIDDAGMSRKREYRLEGGAIAVHECY